MVEVYSRTTMTLNTWYEVLEIVKYESNMRYVVATVGEADTLEKAKDIIPEFGKGHWIIVEHRVVHNKTRKMG
jgi:hypothetical protein